MTDDKRVAVLIDCDNMSHRWVRAILAETAKDGTLGIKRGYGDWNDSHLEGWRDKLPTVRHPAGAAVRLHRRQERDRLLAGDRCHGPALRRHRRHLLHRLQRQRLHPSRDAAPRVRQAGARHRRTQDPGGVPEAPATSSPTSRSSSRTRRRRKSRRPWRRARPRRRENPDTQGRGHHRTGDRVHDRGEGDDAGRRDEGGREGGEQDGRAHAAPAAPGAGEPAAARGRGARPRTTAGPPCRRSGSTS